jgi:putative transposase
MFSLEYSRPGKPTDNAYIESSNGSLREVCLNVNWFMSWEDTRMKLEKWKNDYNEFRPHSGLNMPDASRIRGRGKACYGLKGSNFLIMNGPNFREYL